MAATEQAALNKHLLREALAGYAAAAEVIEQERIERLRHITVEESRREYAGLVAFYQRWLSGLGEPEREGLKRLEEWRLKEKLALRHALQRIALAEGRL